MDHHRSLESPAEVSVSNPMKCSAQNLESEITEPPQKWKFSKSPAQTTSVPAQNPVLPPGLRFKSSKTFSIALENAVCVSIYNPLALECSGETFLSFFLSHQWKELFQLGWWGWGGLLQCEDFIHEKLMKEEIDSFVWSTCESTERNPTW